MIPFARFLGLLPAVVLLAGCAVTPVQGPVSLPIADSPWAARSQVHQRMPFTAKDKDSGATAAYRWHHYPLPGKRPTAYKAAHHDGRDALMAAADASVSVVRQVVRIEPDALGAIRFSWQVQALLEQADLANKDVADSPVRIVLAFDGDRSRFSPRNAMLSELALAVTGEPLPYATLMYVWSNRRPPGTVITSARTDRIRKLVVESGPERLRRWLDYERDIRADFQKAFGEPPGALVGIGVMTDSDNTRGQVLAWYGSVSLLPQARH